VKSLAFSTIKDETRAEGREKQHLFQLTMIPYFNDDDDDDEHDVISRNGSP
jgi:hypothetical protein